jgi:CspA family cold shock protein
VTTLGINKNKQLIKMNEGTVKFFNVTKGFGFIRDNKNGAEYFVHATGCKDQIKENDNVVFELKEGPKGWSAINVKLV